MTHWLYPANTKFYEVFVALSQSKTYWPMNSKVAIGDVIYIYLAAPHKQIGFSCEVVQIELELESIIEKIRPFFIAGGKEKKPSKPFMKLKVITRLEIGNSTKLDYAHLKENGLTGMLMGPRKLENNPGLLAYIERNI